MSDLKFTDEEIVRALEYCAGDKCNTNCPLSPFPDIPCACILMAQAASIIKCQKAEIAEYQKHIDNDIIYVNRVKAEAIKEFAECAKKRFSEKLGSVNESFFSYSVQREIDTLVKEMTETK
jgi:hypothetical protein